MSLNTPFINPHLAVATIVLADGVERLFCWDLNAMTIFQEIGADHLDGSKQSAAMLRAVLFAGMHADAQARGEGLKWTLEFVGGLVPQSMIGKLIQQVDSLKRAAVHGPGESRPAVAKGAPGRKRKRLTSLRH